MFLFLDCLWERFNTRQSGCDHLQQLATNTQRTDTTEAVYFWNTKLCFVFPSDKALPEFGLLRVRRIKRLFAFSRAYKRPDKTKRGHKVN